MAFGASVRPADSIEPAAWLDEAMGEPRGTVGDLIPAGYDAVVRLHPPASGPGDAWWTEYGAVFTAIARVGLRHTETAERAWFAVWEGHGFDSFSSHVAYWDPPSDDAERRARETEHQRLRDDDARIKREIRAGLAAYPRVERPDRTYYLATGSVSAVEGFEYPGWEGWHNPDLWWPADRSWFVATDVDFWSVFVAGTSGLVRDVESASPTPTERVALDSPLPDDD